MSADPYATAAKYVWEGGSYYDPLVFAYVGGAWRHYPYDGLGSTRQLLDAGQTVTDSYTYEAFGNLLSDGGATPNPYMYVGSLGYYTTGAPSLLHLGARYYNPALGRFLQRDPLLGAGLASPLWRSEAFQKMFTFAYAYCAQNPLALVDPTGLAAGPERCEVCEQYKKCVQRCEEDYRSDRKWCYIESAACVGVCLIVEPTAACEFACMVWYTLCMTQARSARAKCLKRCAEDYPCPQHR